MVLDSELKDLLDIDEAQDFLNKKILWKIFNAIKYSKDVGIRFNIVEVFNRRDYCDIYCFGDFLVAYDDMLKSIKVYTRRKSSAHSFLEKRIKIFFIDCLVFSYSENNSPVGDYSSMEKSKISDIDIVEVNLFVEQFSSELRKLVDKKKLSINSDSFGSCAKNANKLMAIISV